LPGCYAYYDPPARIVDELNRLVDRIKRLEEELERTKQDRNAIAKKTREPLLLKLDHAAERIAQLEQENDAMRADLLLWNEKGVK
jgi:archaellum component FlaC